MTQHPFYNRYTLPREKKKKLKIRKKKSLIKFDLTYLLHYVVFVLAVYIDLRLALVPVILTSVPHFMSLQTKKAKKKKKLPKLL